LTTSEATAETTLIMTHGRQLTKFQNVYSSTTELPLRAIFYPLGYAIEIITNDHAVLKAAHESFGHMRLLRESSILQVIIRISEDEDCELPPEPTRHQNDHLYSLVANAENQATLDLNLCTASVWLQRAAVKNKLYLRYNFIEKVVYLLLGASVVTDLHAACVSKNGKGILICGDSGAGKSTLSYACARSGWTYTSDDTSYLINKSDVPRVIGHSHRIRFRPAAKTLFPELKHRELTPRMEGKPSIEVPISDLPVRMTAMETTVHSVVYLNRSPASIGRIIQLPDGAATERMIKGLYSTGKLRVKHENILKAFSQVPAYELQYCKLDDAIQQLDILVHA
jgi:hypothetical protein